jgi:transcriptional regulator with XRE-family HTH domain
MQLATYLSQKAISDGDFAEAIGVTRQAVHRYKSGERFPERAVLQKISEATEGNVTANDFMPAQAQAEDAA